MEIHEIELVITIVNLVFFYLGDDRKTLNSYANRKILVLLQNNGPRFYPGLLEFLTSFIISIYTFCLTFDEIRILNSLNNGSRPWVFIFCHFKFRREDGKIISSVVERNAE